MLHIHVLFFVPPCGWYTVKLCANQHKAQFPSGNASPHEFCDEFHISATITFKQFWIHKKATVKRPSLVLALSIFPGRRQPSIVDRNELNYRVRNGNGWTLILISTNSMSSSFHLKTTLLYCLAPLLSRLFVVTRTGFEPMLTA